MDDHIFNLVIRFNKIFYMIKVNNNLKDKGRTILYNSDDQFVGIIENQYALLDIRNQIKEQKLNGYYMIYWIDNKVESDNYEIIEIDSDGMYSKHPEHFFDTSVKLLNKLYNI